MTSYRQFCPVAQAAEIVAERWTPLVLRELLMGSHRFNELRHGLPLISPSLLTQRLRALERAGVVRRRRSSDGRGWDYDLTDAGEELRPLIEGLGTWGKRWARRELDRRDLDAGLLMWDLHRNIATERLPEQGVVIFFDLEGAEVKKRYWWLLGARETEVELCLSDPGLPPDVTVHCDLRSLTEVWVGDRDVRDAIRAGTMRLEGRAALTRQFPSWLRLSAFAPVPRQLPAAERQAKRRPSPDRARRATVYAAERATGSRA